MVFHLRSLMPWTLRSHTMARKKSFYLCSGRFRHTQLTFLLSPSSPVGPEAGVARARFLGRYVQLCLLHRPLARIPSPNLARFCEIYSGRAEEGRPRLREFPSFLASSPVSTCISERMAPKVSHSLISHKVNRFPRPE